MTVRNRWLLVAFFLACTGLGYGVYWWHEISLDRQAIASMPYQGPLLDQVRALAAPPKTATDQAAALLARMPEYHQTRILGVLSTDQEPVVRYFAIVTMLPLRDHPHVRAALARAAVEDDEVRNRAAARKVLSGKHP